MRSQHRSPDRAERRWSKRGLVAAAITLALFTSGCSAEELKNGFLPRDSVGATNHTGMITHLWNAGWAAALIVGAITWGLIIWCVVVYRRRKNETGMPVQLRYNLPVEVFYIAVPLIMVMVFFSFTARDQAAIDTPYKSPDEVIEIAGKQWSWDFNYVTEDVYFSGVQVNLDGTNKPNEKAPILYLPANKKIEIKLRSRDVIHSFWVPAFLQKRDMIPGRETSIYLEPLKEGTYAGKCAELCGEYHSEMLFNVKVVSPEEYKAYTDSLASQGNTGQLGPEYDRNPELAQKAAD